MKKAPLLIIVNLIVVQYLSAQVTYTSAVQTISLPTSISNSYINPICKWDDNRSIFFMKHNSTAMYFCVADYSTFFTPTAPLVPMPAPSLTGFYTQVSLPQGYNDMTVNDIYYTDDYAFFCGSIYDNNNVQYAVVGYFKPNEIVSSGTTSIHYCIFLNTTQEDPKVLHRLVAYKNGDDYDVVSYGDVLKGYPATHDFTKTKIVELKKVTTSTPPLCHAADLAYIAIFNPIVHLYQIVEKQYIDDILLTDNYVVLTGHAWNYPAPTPPIAANMYAAYHFGKKGQVVSDITGTANNNQHLDAVWETNDTVIGTSIEGDIFAISYIHVDSNFDYYTRLRVIDLISPSVTYSVEFWKPEKENPVKMVYHSGLNSVEILQSIFNPSDFVMIDITAQSPFSADVLDKAPEEFHMFHETNGKGFAASNNRFIYLQNRASSLPPSTAGCPNINSVDVYPIEKIDLDITPKPSLSNCQIYSVPSSSNNKPLTFTNQCFSYE